MIAKKALSCEIVTKYAIFPKYVYDFGSLEVVLVWGRYYQVRHYYYKQGYDHEYTRRTYDLRNFVSLDDAKKYIAERLTA